MVSGVELPHELMNVSNFSDPLVDSKLTQSFVSGMSGISIGGEGT
jgi:hypothetical protein